MKSGAAIAVILAMLPLPALAQRGSARGGSFGSRGYGGHPGFSAHRGLVGNRGAPEPGGYAPAAPFRYGSLGPPPAVRFDPPRISTPHIGVSQNGIVAPRPAYRADFAGRAHSWNGHGDRGREHRRGRDGGHNRDRDRFHGRARSFESWYPLGYPGWVGYGYPYAVDPEFYDGSDYDNSAYGQNDEGAGYNNGNPGYPPDYSNEENSEPGGAGFGEAGEQPQPWPEPPASEPGPDSHFSVAGLSAASEPAPGGPLRVIFKGGRAPETMQNYMLTAKSLTDLDADHYEQIPLDEIDLAATTLANRASGLEFRVPDASRD